MGPAIIVDKEAFRSLFLSVNLGGLGLMAACSCVNMLKCNLEFTFAFLTQYFTRMASLLITWPAYYWKDQPSYRSYHLQNSILIYWSYRKDPYCILLLSVMPLDAAQKRDYEIRLIGSWDLGFLFQKVLPAGHNAGRVIIMVPKKSCRIFTGGSLIIFSFLNCWGWCPKMDPSFVPGYNQDQ